MRKRGRRSASCASASFCATRWPTFCDAATVRDPDLVGVSVTVTQVIPSPDMRHATVFCEPLGGKNAGPVIAALNKHKGFLRGEMGRMIELKFTPELRFVEDTSFAEAEKIETLLKSPRVRVDLSQPAPGEAQEDDDEP